MRGNRPLEIRLSEDDRARWDAAASPRPTASWVRDLVERELAAAAAPRRPKARTASEAKTARAAVSPEEARFKGPDPKPGQR